MGLFGLFSPFKIQNGVLVEYKNKSACEVVIPDTVTEIGAGAFAGCTALSSVTIPSSVKKIANEAYGQEIVWLCIFPTLGLGVKLAWKQSLCQWTGICMWETPLSTLL